MRLVESAGGGSDTIPLFHEVYNVSQRPIDARFRYGNRSIGFLRSTLFQLISLEK